MKRIICIILVVISLFSFMLIPVSATSEETPSAFDPSFINLLGHPSYTMTQGSISQTSNKPLFNMTQSGEIKYILGDGENRYTCDYFIACVYAKYQPTKVRISNESIGEGIYISSVGNYHYYRFDKNKTIVDRLFFFITMPSAYRGTVGLDMLMGVCNDTIEINNVILSTWGRFKEDGVYYKQELFNQNVTLPYAYQKDYITNGTTADPVEFYVSFKYTFDIPVAESFSFVFTSASIWDDNYDEGDIFHGGITLTDSTGTVLQTLPYAAIDTTASSVLDGITVSIYTVNVDLSGLDLQGNSLRFTACLSPVFPHYGTAADNDYNFYHFRLYSAGYKLQHDDTPWYLSFFHWVRSEFTNLKALLSRSFNTLNSNLYNWFSSLETTIQNALGLNAAAPDLTEQQQDMEESQQDMNSASQEFDDTRVEIEGIIDDVPSYEGWSDDSLIPDFDQTGLADLKLRFNAFILDVAPIFTAIWENRFILEIVVMAFLFSLGGFILFGER